MTLAVTAPGTHGSTGDPAFTSSLPPESANGGIPAANDHPKWLAYMNRLSPAGFPGFDASAVPDPQTDPRLAAFAMTAIDVESWMVGLEGFFREAGRPAVTDGPPPPIDDEEIARTLAAGAKYGLRVVDWAPAGQPPVA